MQKSNESEVAELAELTPFDESSFRAESSFRRGYMFVETGVLQSTSPLVPWLEERAGT